MARFVGALCVVLVLCSSTSSFGQGVDVMLHLKDSVTTSGELLSVQEDSLTIVVSTDAGGREHWRSFAVSDVRRVSFEVRAPGTATAAEQILAGGVGLAGGGLLGTILARGKGLGIFILGGLIGASIGCFLGLKIIDAVQYDTIEIDPSSSPQRTFLRERARIH